MQNKKMDELLALYAAFSERMREQLFISNVVKFRPYRVGATGRRANRPPTRAEIAACRDCLLGESAILRPGWVVTLGNTALQAMLGREATIGQMHGTVQRTEAGQRVFPLYHPASIIYNRALEEVYRQDLCALRAALRLAK